MTSNKAWLGSAAAALILGLCGAPAVADAPIAAILADTPTAQPAQAGAPGDMKMIQDPTLRMTVPVMIDGQGPFQFMVDTGSDRTVISAELAARLKLPAGPMVTMHQSVGVDQVGTVVIDKLAVGQRVVEHINAPALLAANLGADGMLGVDSLHDLHVVMDFKAMRLTTSPSMPPTIGLFDSQTIVVQGRSRFGQLILVDAYVRGVKVYVVLDSGSQITIGNPALLKLLDGAHPPPRPQGDTQITSVTGRKLMVPVSQVDETHIGALIIRDLPMAFAQLHTFDRFGLTDQPALLLGMDVMSQCRLVTVDLRRREATFVLN